MLDVPQLRGSGWNGRSEHLDFMKGELTTGEIANMSGMIWNHVHTLPRIHGQPDGQPDRLPPQRGSASRREDES
jgi:hypothetical protein